MWFEYLIHVVYLQTTYRSTDMSSFISSLTSRKKSPEKLVRLAMQCLSTLAAEEAAAAVAMQRLSIITSSSGSGSAADGGSPATPRSSTTSGPTSPHHASSSSSGLDADAAQAKRVEEANAQLCKRLSQMKAILYGSEDKLEIDEHKAEELSLCIQSVFSSSVSIINDSGKYPYIFIYYIIRVIQEGLLLVLVHQLNSIPFEVRYIHISQSLILFKCLLGKLYMQIFKPSYANTCM